MCWPLRSALEHVKEMQSSGKGYLPTNNLKERNTSNEVKAMDQGNDGAAAAEFMIATPEISRLCSK